MASTTTKAPSKPAAATKAPKAPRAVKTRPVVMDDSGKGSTPRTRTYKVINRDTDDVLGYVVEVWQDGKMDWQNSVKEGRRALSAMDANRKPLGKDYGSRALAVAAVRRNATA